MSSFYEDVIKNDARFNSANRMADPELLEPVTRAAIANIFARRPPPGESS